MCGTIDTVLGGIDEIAGGITGAVESVADPVMDTTGAWIDDGMDWAMDDFIPAVLPGIVAGMAGGSLLAAYGGSGMMAGGEYLSGMDLAADGGVGNMWGLNDAVGSGSGLDMLGDAVSGAGPSSSVGDWGGAAEWMSDPEPWRTVGNGMPSSSGGFSMPSWLQSPEGIAGKLGEKVLSSKLSDLFAGGAGLDQRNSQQQAGEKTVGQIEDLKGRIDGLYAPGSPEFEYMKKTMERKDAAAGRRSQYGPRMESMAGLIAGEKAKAYQALGSSTMPAYAAAQGTMANKNSGLWGSLGKAFQGTTLGDLFK